MAANGRKAKQRVERLQNDEGVWVEKNHGLEEVVVNYFQKSFIKQEVNVDVITQCIERRVLENQNELLCAPFSAKEVKSVAISMHRDKSPGEDGFNPGFFKKFWGVVGKDVVDACISWINEGSLPREVNNTNIVLIPKVSNPSNMKEFRPISLCNVIYKIMSKMMANRLKSLLPNTISQSQSAFIEGRLITDNIIIANEITHFMKGRRRGKEGWLALILDLAKAYYRIDWEYIEAILRAMGFWEKWIQLVGACVRTVCYKVMVNGEL